jgi:predicted dehydrogenase
MRIGVVGLGKRAELAALLPRIDGDAAVTVAADPNPYARARARSLFGPQVTTVVDHDEFSAADVDAVMIVSPDHTHEDIAVRFLAAGVPVFVEKPLAITVEGCDRILAAAKEHGIRLYVGHNMRHMPVITQLRDLITEGRIGEVKAIWCRHFVGRGGDYYFKDWHAERRFTTSLLLQKGAHDIDVIHWLAGGYTRRVSAMGGLTVYGQVTDRGGRDGQTVREWTSDDNWPPLAQTGLSPVIDVEDLEMVNMELDNGVFAAYQQCHFTPDYWRNYTIIGTEGRVENFGDTTDDAVVRLWNKRTSYNPAGDHQFPVPSGRSGHGGADEAILSEFLRFVRHGGATRNSPLAARNSGATAVLAAHSLRHASSPCDGPALAPDIAEYFDASL